MSDTVVVDGVCELDIPIEGECGTFYKVNPTSEALTVSPTSEDVTYQPDADYFSEVTVEGIKGERTITRNGDYDVLTDKQVTVAVDPPVLDSLTATANGTYTPQGDGFSEVTVDVPPDTVPLNVTANGEYTRDGGYNPVTVEIPEYEGNYTVTPTTEVQTLPTAGKVMEQDVTVEAVEPVLWKTVTLDEPYTKLGLASFMSLLEIKESDVLAGYNYLVFAIGNTDTSIYALKVEIIGIFDGYPDEVRGLTIRKPNYSNLMFGNASNVGRYISAGTVIKVYRFKR